MKNRLWFFLSILVLCVCPTLSAQEPASAPASAPATASQPATPVIPPAEIITQSETVKSELPAINADLEANPIIEGITNDLPERTQEIAARRQDTARILLSRPSLETISSEESNWQAFASTFAEWKRDLAARAEVLEARRASLQRQLDAWQQTLDTAPAAKIPPEVVKQISATVDGLSGARTQADERRTDVLRLQAEVAAQGDEVTAALDTLADARRQVLKDLFTQETVPVWKIQFGQSAASTTSTAPAANRVPWSAQFVALRGYLVRGRDRFGVQAIMLALLTIGLFWARARFQVWVANEKTLAPAAPVFDSPLAGAVILSLLLSLWLHPQAPRLFWSLSAAMVILPATLLIRRLTEKYMTPLLYALVSFFFVDQFRAVILGFSPWPRLLFLAEMLAAIFFLTWFIFSHHKSGDQARPGRLRMLQAACRFALILFVIAFAANAFGYGRLGFLVGGSVLRSAYLALILYTMLAVTDGLVIVLLHMRPFVHLAAVRHHAALLRARTRRFLNWAATLLWIYLSLRMLYVAAPAMDAAEYLFTTPVHLGVFEISLGQVVSCVVAVWASFAVSRFIRFLMQEDVYPHVSLPRGLGNAISTIIHYAVLVVGFAIAIAVLGFPMSQFTILTGAFGVGLGFGLQTIINNFFSGIIVLAERPIQVGDVIEMDAIVGTVTRIGIRATVMRTAEGSEIILPNARLIAERVINWTLSDRSRGFEISVNVDGAADPRQVIKLLEEAANNHPHVCKDPPPLAQLGSLAGGTSSFQLRLWTNSIDEWKQVRSDVNVAVHDALAKAQIAIK